MNPQNVCLTDSTKPARTDSANSTEDRLARFLDEALDRQSRGENVDVSKLLADRPDLIDQGRQLMAGMGVLRDALGPVKPAPIGQPSPDDLQLPAPLNEEFQVEGELGRGTFGRVLLARERPPMSRRVAIKTLHLPGDGRGVASALAALQRDARFLAEVQQRRPQRNVVQVYAWREVRGQHFLVMQYIPGCSLDRLVKTSGPLDWQRATRYVADVAEGLQAIHRAGIVHRDVKPANILLDQTLDEAVLTDLGVRSGRPALARPLDRQHTWPPKHSEVRRASNRTSTALQPPCSSSSRPKCRSRPGDERSCLTSSPAVCQIPIRAVRRCPRPWNV